MDTEDKNRDQGFDTLIFNPAEQAVHSPHKRAFLTVIRGGGSDKGLNKAIAETIDVGRSRDCGLCLGDMQVSSRHARISLRTDGCYVLEDLGSTNGTQINGKPLCGVRELLEGDKIFLGETVLRFAMVDAMDLGYHDELSQLARIDPLTGLESKYCFDDALNTALTHVRKQQTALSVLMMDMDGIKAINDTHGHLFGAHAISETGRLIARVLHGRGRVCRFGGDEFTAMLPGLDKQAALQVAENIRWQLTQANLEKNAISLKPTISIGIASYPEDGEQVLELIDAADQALYRAKHAGKNRVSI